MDHSIYKIYSISYHVGFISHHRNLQHHHVKRLLALTGKPELLSSAQRQPADRAITDIRPTHKELYMGVMSERRAQVALQVWGALLLYGNAGAAKPGPFRLWYSNVCYCCCQCVDYATFILVLRPLARRIWSWRLTMWSNSVPWNFGCYNLVSDIRSYSLQGTFRVEQHPWMTWNKYYKNKK